MREWCGDLAALLDAERCSRAVIAGHCLGAHIALQFATRYPQRTAALVLIEPMPRQALLGAMKWVPPLRPAIIGLARLVRSANTLGMRRRSLHREGPFGSRANLHRDARASHAEIVSIEAGHWIPAEQPDAMRAAIDEWLGRGERSGAFDPDQEKSI